MKCILILCVSFVLCLIKSVYFVDANWCIQDITTNIVVTKRLTKFVTYKKWFRVKKKLVEYTATQLVPRVRKQRVCCEGYSLYLNGTNTFCKPNCFNGCPQYSKCVRPNTCECQLGYQKKRNSKQNGRCEPFCHIPCEVNAFCSSPDVCKCKPDFVYNYSTRSCESIFRELSTLLPDLPKILSTTTLSTTGQTSTTSSSSTSTTPVSSTSTTSVSSTSPNTSSSTSTTPVSSTSTTSVPSSSPTTSSSTSTTPVSSNSTTSVPSSSPTTSSSTSTTPVSSTSATTSSSTSPTTSSSTSTTPVSSTSTTSVPSTLPTTVSFTSTTASRKLSTPTSQTTEITTTFSTRIIYVIQSSTTEEDGKVTKEQILSNETLMMTDSAESTKSHESFKLFEVTTTENLISSNCERECFNGICLNGLCQCSTGSVFNQESKRCISNSTCHQGFVYQNNIGCVSSCEQQKCINGICVAPDKCQCLDGFSHDPENIFECKAIGNLSPKIERHKLNDFPWIWIISSILSLVIIGLLLIYKARKRFYHVEEVEKGRHIVHFENL